MNASEIKEFRKKHNITQQELADMLGVTITTVRSWEYGQRNISASSVKYIQAFENAGYSYKSEVTPVPEDDYMMVEFEDLETAAGKLGGGDLSVLPERKRRLVPKEYKKGNYLVVRVHGHSMDDNTKRSISEGEELLIKECFESDFNLPIRNKLFVIVTNEGSVIKQIKEIDKENQRVICHSFNPNWEDYSISFNEIIQLFTVEKKVKSNIIF